MPRSIAQYQFTYREFYTRFKLIRHERNFHLHEHLLMRDRNTKKTVVVKNHVYADTNELKAIINDYKQLILLHQSSRSSQYLCSFVGYCLQESSQLRADGISTQDSINLIYEFNENTLHEELANMRLHHKKMTEKEIQCLLSHLIEGLSVLESHEYSHQCLNSNNVLVEQRGNIDMKFMLIFTPFLSTSIEEIECQKANIEDYNLSQLQLKMLSETKTDDPNMEKVSFSEKIRSDKQSLGVMALRLATLDPSNARFSEKFYMMNENFELAWNSQVLEHKLLDMRHNYSKSLCEKIEYLLFGKAFYSFKDLPPSIFGTNLSNSNRSSRKKSQRYSPLSRYISRVSSHSKSRSFSKSRSSSLKNEHRTKSNLKSLERRRISFSPNTIHINEFQTPQPTYQTNRQSEETQKKVAYERLLKQLQTSILSKIPKQSLHKVEDPVTLQKYIGNIHHGRKEGLGLNYCPNGDVYGGEWQNDEMEGDGVYLFNSCDIYTGKISKGLKHGHGRYEYWNGNIYEGAWKNDQKHGRGKLSKKSECEIYEGEFHNNRKHGNGIYWFKNGDRYEGEFRDGLKDGNGIYFKNKNTYGTTTNTNNLYLQYRGKWEEDKLGEFAVIEFTHSGLVIKCDDIGDLNNKETWQLNTRVEEESSDGVKFLGTYRKMKRNGNCEIVYGNGDRYCGEIVDDKFEGRGTYFYKHFGYEYTGMWRNSKPEGEGKITFNNGTQIECVWSDGKPQSFGKIKYQNGDEYIGEISAIGRHGRGAYVSKKGQHLKGLFNNGKFVQSN